MLIPIRGFHMQRLLCMSHELQGEAMVHHPEEEVFGLLLLTSLGPQRVTEAHGEPQLLEIAIRLLKQGLKITSRYSVLVYAIHMYI